MLKDITLGQFFPGNSLIHRLDPRTKLLLLIGFIVGLFLCESYFSYGLALAFLGSVIALSRIRLKALFKGMKTLLIIIIFTALLNLFYTKGTVLVEFWIFKITKEGIFNAVNGQQQSRRDAETQSCKVAECCASTGSATENGSRLTALYIDPKQIKLEGHDHGFFPGCCGVWKNNLIVCGSTKNLKEKEELDKFLEDNNFNLIELYDGELVDVGSIFFN